MQTFSTYQLPQNHNQGCKVQIHTIRVPIFVHYEEHIHICVHGTRYFGTDYFAYRGEIL